MLHKLFYIIVLSIPIVTSNLGLFGFPHKAFWCLCHFLCCEKAEWSQQMHDRDSGVTYESIKLQQQDEGLEGKVCESVCLYVVSLCLFAAVSRMRRFMCTNHVAERKPSLHLLHTHMHTMKHENRCTVLPREPSLAN